MKTNVVTHEEAIEVQLALALPVLVDLGCAMLVTGEHPVRGPVVLCVNGDGASFIVSQ